MEKIGKDRPQLIQIGLIFFLAIVVLICTWAIRLNSDNRSKAAGTTQQITSLVGSFKGSPITLLTSDIHGGAIYSLKWQGKEFLDTHDNGRQLQSAISFNDMGGCLNPTEAGNSNDLNGMKSSTKLLQSDVGGNILRTKSQMAYWLNPGQLTIPYCGNINRSTLPIGRGVNTSIISNIYFAKTVQLGADGLPNVIDYTSRFILDKSYQSVLFEALTAYMPVEFSQFLTYNPVQKTISSLSSGAGYPTYNAYGYDVVRDQLQSYPIIIATPDNQFAMGIYSPDMANRFTGPGYGNWQYGIKPLGYGRWKFTNSNVNKWNLMFRGGFTPSGTYNFRQFVIVGTVSDVTQAIDKLYVINQKDLSRIQVANIISQSFNLKLITQTSDNFIDTPVSTYGNAAKIFADNQVTTGCLDNPRMFCPDRITTRADAATFLLRTIKKPTNPQDITPIFADVPQDQPLFQYIQLLGRLKLTTGCAQNPIRFCPDDPITQQDLNTFISRIKALH